MRHLVKTLSIQSSPHLKSGARIDDIMRNVVYALVPVVGFAIYAFGWSALLVLLVATLTCTLTEVLLVWRKGKMPMPFDWSVVVTGLLFGLTLPPSLPLWMVALGGFVAVYIGKFLFGGLGANAFNPALVGRAFLQAAFPVALTSWTPPFASQRFSELPSSTLTWPLLTPEYDAISAATPLALHKFEHSGTDPDILFFGLTGGSLGETSSLMIVLGGLWLVVRNMMNWRIPVAILSTVFMSSWILHSLAPQQYGSPLFMLFSGGLMLGAVFMATDMVASPMSQLGVVIYGIVIGLLVVVIRCWGGMPEGVMYAILLANALSPHIDYLTQPKVFGQLKLKTSVPGAKRGDK